LSNLEANQKRAFQIIRDINIQRKIARAILNQDSTTALNKLTSFIMDELEERQLLQEELLKSEEKYRMLLEQGLDGVVVTRAREYLYVNKRFVEMLGYSDPSELLGKNTSEMIDPEYMKHMEAIAARRQNGDMQKLSYETKLLKKDGSPIWVEVISSGIEYERDQAVITHARDITERKQMEEELRVREG
jgi:PAS domain S-box-containing protein